MAGLLLCIVGLVWLGQANSHASYWLHVALPMLLIGLGQGVLMAPLTAAGVAGVAHKDTGAASGLVNVAHQFGGSLGLGVLVLVFASAAPAPAHDIASLAQRIATVMDASALMLALAGLVAWICIINPHRRGILRQKESLA